MKSFSLICIAFALSVGSDVWQAHAKSTLNATATIFYGDGSSITITDFSNQISVHRQECVNVTMQFDASVAGQPVIIEPEGGGATGFGRSIPVIGNDGSISFGFLAPNRPGVSPVHVRIGSTLVRLQFSIANS